MQPLRTRILKEGSNENILVVVQINGPPSSIFYFFFIFCWVVESFYDALVGDGSIPMNSCGFARGLHPSAKRARSLTTRALVRAGSQEKRAHSVGVVTMD